MQSSTLLAPSLRARLHSPGLEAAHCTASAILTIVWDSCACRTGERELGASGRNRRWGGECEGERCLDGGAICLQVCNSRSLSWSTCRPVRGSLGEFSEFMHKEPNCVERCLTVGSVTDVKAQKWWRIQGLAESNSPTHNITTGLVVILIMPKDKGGMAVKTKSVDKSCRDETGFKHRSHRPKVHLSSSLGQFNQRLSLSDQINRGLKK